MAQNISNLPIGAKIKFGRYQVASETPQEIIHRIAAKNHSCTPAYPANSVTLITDRIIDFRALDAKEPSNSNSDRKRHGNNRYSQSNLDQWLNKDSAPDSWYVAQHSADAPSNTSDSVYNHDTQYSAKSGFMYHFTDAEKAAILLTTIRVVKCSVDGGGYEDIVRKIFNPSTTEIGLANESDIAEGAKFTLFSDNASLITYATQQAIFNSPSRNKPANTGTAWHSWLRTPHASYSYRVWFVRSEGARASTYPATGNYGVRPALNLPSSISVSDTTDGDGCYTIIWNTPPSPPSSITVPNDIFGGKTANISWGASTDVDGNLVGYTLERSVNSGTYAQIYKANARAYTDTITFGWNTVRYRVKAYDVENAESTYTTSALRNVINNVAPVISGSDANLGTKTAGFTQSYTVTDADGDTVTVTEALDGGILRTYTVVLGATNLLDITGETWLKILNGFHTLTITATDTLGNKAVRTYTFTKNMTTFTVQPSEPMQSATMPTRMAITVSRSIPGGAEFKVEVCNNGYDATPTWEDATSAVVGNLVHVFTNTNKTAVMWGVRIRVTVRRLTAQGACYVTAIGGNFE